MSSECGMEPFRPGRWRGAPLFDLAWSLALVGLAFLGTRWLGRFGAATDLTLYLTAVVLAGAGRGLRSGLAAAVSVVALFALHEEPFSGWSPPDHSALLLAFLAVSLAAGFATGHLRDEVRRLEARRRAMLSLARSYVAVMTETEPLAATSKLAAWVHRVIGTDACYLDDPEFGPKTAWDPRRWAPAGLMTLATDAWAQPGRTLRSGALRVRALRHGDQVVAVLAWRSPKLGKSEARFLDLVVADVADLLVAIWPRTSAASSPTARRSCRPSPAVPPARA